MYHVVNGVKYDDYNEALKAEKELAESEVSLLLKNMEIYSTTCGGTSAMFVIVTENNHIDYARVLARKVFGEQCYIDGNKHLVRNYILSKCVSERLLNDMAKCFVEGRGAGENVYYFNNLTCKQSNEDSCEKDDTSDILPLDFFKLFMQDLLK